MHKRVTIPLAVAEWFPVLLGLLVLYIPTYVNLAHTLWASEEQSQGPIILSIAIWYFWSQHRAINALPTNPAASGWILFVIGLLLYILGCSQDILIFEVGSQIPIVAGLLLIVRGWAALRVVWFPLLFLIFMLPLPGAVVDTLTLPMKLAVSWATDLVLYGMGYPISRSGVILQIGQYKLLVADACAGLHTLFTLEALGLLYLHMVRHESVMRNTLLATMIIPISFTANTIRVIILTLITYYFGDGVGQGFLHGYAGMVLFISALLLITSVDSLLQYGVEHKNNRDVHDRAAL